MINFTASNPPVTFGGKIPSDPVNPGKPPQKPRLKPLPSEHKSSESDFSFTEQPAVFRADTDKPVPRAQNSRPQRQATKPQAAQKPVLKPFPSGPAKKNSETTKTRKKRKNNRANKILAIVFGVLGLADIVGIGAVSYLFGQRNGRASYREPYLQNTCAQEYYQNQSADFSFEKLNLPNGDLRINSIVNIPHDIRTQVTGASVQVVHSVLSGSGVIIQAADGQFYILTNHHVVNYKEDTEPQATYIYQTTPDALYPTELIHQTNSPDLALLRVTDPNFQPTQFIPVSQFRDLAQAPLLANEPVFFVGYPGPILADIMSNRTLKQDGQTIVIPGQVQPNQQCDQPVRFWSQCNPGASGSPVFDRQGRLIGLVTWMDANPVDNENALRCHAIQADGAADADILQWLSEAGIPTGRPSQ